jgi:hypothetical protein
MSTARDSPVQASGHLTPRSGPADDMRVRTGAVRTARFRRPGDLVRRAVHVEEYSLNRGRPSWDRLVTMAGASTSASHSETSDGGTSAGITARGPQGAWRASEAVMARSE